MCLGLIIKNYKEKLGTPKYGWKVFHKDENGELHSKYHPAGAYKINRWIKNKSSIKNLETSIGAKEKYRNGFHVYKTRESARSDCCRCNGEEIRKVKIRDATCCGAQLCDIVYVAQEILITKTRG